MQILSFSFGLKHDLLTRELKPRIHGYTEIIEANITSFRSPAEKWQRVGVLQYEF